MQHLEFRNSLRERILYDLKNIVKQVYHESVNNELSPENKTYICITLIKNLDEVLRHGLKQLHLGYWKAICEILHPQTLESVEGLPLSCETECNGLFKGKAWIALSLKDESFVNYIQCLVTEGCLEKYYDDWSILRTNDSCNNFLSVLSGLDNITFNYEMEYINKMPNSCSFGRKECLNNERNTSNCNISKKKNKIDLQTSVSSITSPVDSGIHIQDSTYDMEQLSDDNKNFYIDFLNGNVPEQVLLRKQKKNCKRHVSFHEDIIYKNQENCRKLKWDSENMRYSWSGEQIDSRILQNSDFAKMKVHKVKESETYSSNERGVPEEKTEKTEIQPKVLTNKPVKPMNTQKFLSSTWNQLKLRHNRYKRVNCTNRIFKKLKFDATVSKEIDREIEKELIQKPKAVISKHEVNLNLEMVKDMICNQTVYKSYLLREYLLIITNANLLLVNKNLEMKRMRFGTLHEVVVYPDSHAFFVRESEENDGTHDKPEIIVTGDVELTQEILGRLEYSMRRSQFEPPLFHMLDYEYFSFVMKSLVDQFIVDRDEEIVHSGCVRLFKENDLLYSMLPNSKRGFLMYRLSEFGEGWIPGEFYLKNGFLYLFEDDKNLPKLTVNVADGCRSCNRTNTSNRPHTFQITLAEDSIRGSSGIRPGNLSKSVFSFLDRSTKPNQKFLARFRQKVGKVLPFGGSKESLCVLELAAANENELTEWFHMIIQSSCGDPCEEAHKDDLIKGKLWITSKTLIITNEIWFPDSSNFQVISCAQLKDVATLEIGELDEDFFLVIEFICMEARSTSGDWILYLGSREELMKLILVLQKYWKFQDKFPCGNIKEEKLLNRCRKSQENLIDNYWNPLLQCTAI